MNSQRDKILNRVINLTPGRSKRRPAKRDTLSWEDLAPVIEGLAVAQRPIAAATRAVTRRFDLGPRGTYILSLISGGIIYPLDLATALRVGRSLITAELGRLSEAGLITSTPGQSDRRRTELALTDTGRAAAEEVREKMARILMRNLGGYTRSEVRLFGEMLRDARFLTESELE